MRRRIPDDPPLSDAELVEAARTGSPDAFGKLVERYQPGILRFLRRKTRGDVCAAEDLAQDTFQHAFIHIGEIREDARFNAWLHTIARRAWLMKERGHSRHPAVSLNSLQKQDTRNHHLTCHSPDLEAHANRQLLIEAFHSISPALQRAFTLHYIEGYSHAEVASIERITPSAAQSRAYRASREIRIRLDELARDTASGCVESEPR